MSSPMRQIIYSAVYGLLCVPSVVRAQPALSDSACAERTTAANAGRAKVQDLHLLRTCGAPGERALARVIREAGPRTDTAFLQRMIAVSGPPSEEIFEAALVLAKSKVALPASRVSGLRILLRQTYGAGMGLTFGDNVSLDGDRCSVIFVASKTPVSGKDRQVVGPARSERLRQETEALALDPTAPDDVRAGARCIRNMFQPKIDVPQTPPAVTLTHRCETRFQIRNSGSAAETFAWEVIGTGVRGFITARPGVTSFRVLHPGDVRLLRGVTEITRAAARAGTRCPG